MASHTATFPAEVTALGPAARLLTVPQMVEAVPWLTEGSLRWQIRRAAALGLEQAIVRLHGGRLLIDPEAYGAWVESRRGR